MPKTAQKRLASVADRRQAENPPLPAGERGLAHLAALHCTGRQPPGGVFKVPRRDHPAL